MNDNKELQRTITKAIVKSQFVGIAISIVATLVIGLILASFSKEKPSINEEK